MAAKTNGRVVLVVVLPVVLLAGCRYERYYGPFEFELPGNTNLSSTFRTFALPLDSGQLEQLSQLEGCDVSADPQCPCRLPVVTTGQYRTRIDYWVENRGTDCQLMVWAGARTTASPPPNEVAGFADVHVLLEHHHRIGSDEQVPGSFLPDDYEQAELRFSRIEYPQCDLPDSDLPAPRRLLVGASLESGADGADVKLIFSVLLEGGRWP